MSAPRLRRLAADYEAVRSEFSGHPHVHIAPLGPQRPPEAYRVTYRVRGLRLDGTQPVVADEHLVEVRLPIGYPRDKPYCTPLSPVFHPNIKDYYCIQDYWAAGQSLVDTIAKIADMIQYRIYNVGSPLDAIAARWASENAAQFPLGNVTLGTPEVAIRLGARSGGAPAVTASLPAVADDAPVAVAAPAEDAIAVTLRRGGP